MTSGVRNKKQPAERNTSGGKITSIGEARAHFTEDEDDMSDFSESDIQDIAGGLKHVKADDQSMDVKGNGWKPVANGARNRHIHEYHPEMQTFEEKNFWSKLAAKKHTNRSTM